MSTNHSMHIIHTHIFYDLCGTALITGSRVRFPVEPFRKIKLSKIGSDLGSAPGVTPFPYSGTRTTRNSLVCDHVIESYKNQHYFIIIKKIIIKLNNTVPLRSCTETKIVNLEIQSTFARYMSMSLTFFDLISNSFNFVRPRARTC